MATNTAGAILRRSQQGLPKAPNEHLSGPYATREAFKTSPCAAHVFYMISTTRQHSFEIYGGSGAASRARKRRTNAFRHESFSKLPVVVTNITDIYFGGAGVYDVLWHEARGNPG